MTGVQTCALPILKFEIDEIAATPAIAAEPVKKDLLLGFLLFFICKWLKAKFIRTSICFLIILCFTFQLKKKSFDYLTIIDCNL